MVFPPLPRCPAPRTYRSGAPEVGGRRIPRHQRRRRELRGEIFRTDAQEDGIERSDQHFGSAEDLHLRPLGRILGRELHRAAAEEHDGRDALGRFGDERGSGFQVEREIRSLDGQVADVERQRGPPVRNRSRITAGPLSHPHTPHPAGGCCALAAPR